MSNKPTALQHDALADYSEHLRSILPTLPGHEHDWLASTRSNAIEQFEQSGFPTRQHEAWRYVPANLLAERCMKPSPNTPALVDEALVSKASIDDLPVYRLVFAGERLLPSLSNITALPSGVTLRSLNDAAADTDNAAHSTFKQAFTATQPPAHDAFTAINGAIWQDGVHLYLSPGTVLDKPVHIITVGTAGYAAQLRTIIYASQDSQAQVIYSHISSEGASFYNGVTSVKLERGATVTEYRHQAEAADAHHLHTTYVQAAEHSRYHNITLSTGAGVARQQLHTITQGEGATIQLDGAFIARDAQVMDHYLPAEHDSPGTRSSQFYKGVVAGKAKSNFYGKLVVPPHATDTEAHQQCRGLSLSERAEFNARPELEIHTDEVQCSHGVAIGNMDEEALYYLQARGIDEHTAHQLLVQGFLDEVLDRITLEPLRECWKAKLHEVLEAL